MGGGTKQVNRGEASGSYVSGQQATTQDAGLSAGNQAFQQQMMAKAFRRWRKRRRHAHRDDEPGVIKHRRAYWRIQDSGESDRK